MLFHSSRLGIALAIGSLSAITLLPGVSNAVQLRNSRTAFDSSPQLLDVSSSNTSREASSTYFFTIKVPENAGTGLKALRIQALNNQQPTVLRANTLKAFVGKPGNKGKLQLAGVGGPDKPDALSVVFSEPVRPGEIVTVSVKPDRNPFDLGYYNYSVTAFPEGPDGIAQPLGIGRITVDGD